MTTVCNRSENKSYSLLVHGGHSRRHGEALLASDPADGSSWLVFYFDTAPVSQETADVRRRSECFDLLDQSDTLEIDQLAANLLHSWPRLEHTRLNDGPPLRDHCNDVYLQKRLVTHLLNLKISEKLFERYSIRRIHLGQGGGISEFAWKQVAERKGLPLQRIERDHALPADQLMPLDWPPRRVVSADSRQKKRKRPIGKLLQGWRSRRAVMRAANRTHGRRLVFCTSNLINRIYAQQIESCNRDSAVEIVSADVWTLRSHRGRIGSLTRNLYRERWLEFSSQLRGLDASQIFYCGQDLRPWLLDGFEEIFRRRYPQGQRTLDRAVAVLGRLKPAALLNDTQLGNEESIWGLAARSLGIRVYSYTYDLWPFRRTSWSPDFVLVDSWEMRKEALARNFRDEQLIDVRSHRQAGVCRLNEEGVAAGRAEWGLFSADSIVLCADTWYAGMRAFQDPAISYSFYRAICLLAEKYPGTTFVIRFHPFRGRKKTNRTSMAFDRKELDRRRAFIKQLSPPENVKLLTVETPLQPMLGLCLLVLNIESAVAIEAMTSGVPVLYFNGKPNLEIIVPRLDEFGGCFSADDVDGFVELTGRFLSDPSLREKLVEQQSRYLNECHWKHQTDMISAVVDHLESA